MKKRETLIALLALGAAPFTAKAQPAGKIPRVGVLWHDASAEAEGAYFNDLIEGFRNLGYIDGRNIILEHRFPNEVPERFASMAAELVAAKVDVLVGVGASASQYVKDATATIPTVFMYVPDPVRSKLVESLGRPGGNTTGLTNSGADLTALRLQFLKELVPGLSRAALLVNPNSQISSLYIQEAQAAAAKLRFTVQPYEARSLDELKAAFDAMTKARVQAVYAPPRGIVLSRTRIDGKTGAGAASALVCLGERGSGGRCAHVLRPRPGCHFPADCGFRRQNSQRCQARRSSRRAAHQVRVPYQRQDRASTGREDPASASAAGR